MNGVAYYFKDEYFLYMYVRMSMRVCVCVCVCVCVFKLGMTFWWFI